MFKKLYDILSSRTVLTVIGLVIFSISDEVRTALPQDLYVLIASVCGALAIYFRIDAKKIFDK